MKFRHMTLLLCFSGMAQAEDCNCYKYPFEPDSCYTECTNSILLNDSIKVSEIEGMDYSTKLTYEYLRSQSYNGALATLNISNEAQLQKIAVQVVKKSEDDRTRVAIGLPAGLNDKKSGDL